MFKIVIADGKHEMPEDDVYYLIAKEGMYVKKKLGIMESLSPVKNISILQSVQATAKMHIAKLPGILTAKIANFFREVQKEHRSEAIVLLFYNEETKKYKIVPPSQKVSGASLDYNRSVVIEGWIMIGDIHSHSSMSAFHSGTDQGDEESFDGLHITFGNMSSELISISASIVSNGHRTMVSPEDYMNGILLDHEIDEIEKIPTSRVYRWKDGKMVEDTPKYSATTYKSYRKYDKRYKILSEQSVKAKCPSAWMKTVEYKAYSYSYGGMESWYGGWEGNYQSGRWEKGKWIPASYNNKWGKNFDSRAWSKHRPPGQTVVDARKNAPPQNVGVKVDPVKFPEHDQGPVITDVTPSRYMPCKTCAFKEKAIEYVAELLVEENEGIIEDKELFVDKEVYQCEKCNLIVSFEYDENGDIEGDIICPSCKVDDHLMLLDDLSLDEEDEPEEIGTDTGLEGDKFISCKTCNSRFSLSMLKEDDDGGSCPFCGTLLVPNQFLNYTKEGDMFSCKTCGSQFTDDLSKEDNCPFCKTSLIKLGGEETTSDLLGEDAEKIEQVSKEEVSNYQAAKDAPNPKDIIPDPAEAMTRSIMNPIQWMYERFGKKR